MWSRRRGGGRRSTPSPIVHYCVLFGPSWLASRLVQPSAKEASLILLVVNVTLIAVRDLLRRLRGSGGGYAIRNRPSPHSLTEVGVGAAATCGGGDAVIRTRPTPIKQEHSPHCIAAVAMAISAAICRALLTGSSLGPRAPGLHKLVYVG